MPLTLVIGNKNYSSWSLRPWLALKTAGIPFDEIRIPLYQAGSKDKILVHSPSGKVPCLLDGKLAIWDSLAICEYVAETHPKANLWPVDPEARAVARSISAEMHSGFMALRGKLSMDIRLHATNTRYGPDVHRDIERITTIWRDCRFRYGAGGPFLFGAFSIADAMYAPVVTRFVSYGIHVDSFSEHYMQAVLALPAMQDWIHDALHETETIQY